MNYYGDSVYFYKVEQVIQGINLFMKALLK
jgi:hypothetical protein